MSGLESDMGLNETNDFIALIHTRILHSNSLCKIKTIMSINLILKSFS